MKRIMLLCLPLGSLSETTHSLEFLREYTLSIIHVLAVVVLLGLWHVRDTYVSSLFLRNKSRYIGEIMVYIATGV